MCPKPTILEGRIERITFRSNDTHFMIAKFRPRGLDLGQHLVTVLGHLPEPRLGETLRLHGKWQIHPRFGQQFKVSAFEVMLPSEVEQIHQYIASGLIKGIGPKTAECLVRHFKADTLTVIESAPERLAEVPGIGMVKARQISTAWQEHQAVRRLMQFLQEHGIKPAYGARIYKTYGVNAIDILQHDPYQVAEDIPRIGFYVADAIVQHSNVAIDETERARACLRHLLHEAMNQGHMFTIRDDLIENCSTTFNLDFQAVDEALEQLQTSQQIVIDLDAPQSPVYLQPLFQAENEIAIRMNAMLTIPASQPLVNQEQIMETMVQRLAIKLSDAQLAVLQGVFTHRVVIITGGPGTGKTTLIRSIAAIFDLTGQQYLLAAPTGRAARRMAEVTRRPAVTLHKLLGFNLSEGRFERDQDNPLETEALIVDEASMVDAPLMHYTIKALPLQARLILVGDVFQLPSVGPGMVLADLIQSQSAQIFELTEIFRQAAQSPIIINAHQVRQGHLPELLPANPSAPLTDFTFIEQSNPDAVARTIVQLCCCKIPRELGLDGIRDVQVLTPMHKGSIGTLNLNRLLQAELNLSSECIESLGVRYCLGDKVMHLRNNYQKEVFNGEIGVICELDKKERWLVVDFEGRRVTYDHIDLDELAPAYAISIHKSQGSEYPVIIVPLLTQHYIMLQRNLLYTALTRAQKLVILIGTPKAVYIAIKTDTPRQRRSLLSWRLNPEMEVSLL